MCKKPAENKAVPDLFQPSNMAVTGVGQISLSSRKFAILGGGISGLAAAYHLLDKVKDPSNITVLESSERVGGWMQSCSTENGAVFELGPRSIRPAGNAGRATLKIVSRIHVREISHVCVSLVVAFCFYAQLKSYIGAVAPQFIGGDLGTSRI